MPPHPNHRKDITMAKAQRLTYFKSSLEDKPGALLAVAKDLKAKNVGLIALWGYSTSQGMAELLVIPKNADKFRKAWKDTGKVFTEATGFLLKGGDKTGALVKPLEAAAQAGINLTGMAAVAVGGKYGGMLWVKAEDVEKAAKILGAK
jgi:hypothetical protein